MKRIIPLIFMLLAGSVVAEGTGDCPETISGQLRRENEREVESAIRTRLNLSPTRHVSVTWDSVRQAIRFLAIQKEQTSPNPGRTGGTDPAEVAAKAFAFLEQNHCALRIDPGTLVSVPVEGWRGKQREPVYVDFMQCYHGLPVIWSGINCEFVNGQLFELQNTTLPEITCPTEPKIFPKEAVTIVQEHERARFMRGDSTARVFAFGIVSEVLYPDFYDIRNEAGEVIPYWNRLVGSQLLIFPDSADEKIIGTLAWWMQFDDGKATNQIGTKVRTPLCQFFVNATTGAILRRGNLSGGCVVTSWQPLTFCGTSK